MSREGAVALLARAYANVFREFARAGWSHFTFEFNTCTPASHHSISPLNLLPDAPNLRLLPLSGGIFRGSFGPELPGMTIEAIQQAFDTLDASIKQRILSDKVCFQLLVLCVGVPLDWAALTRFSFPHFRFAKSTCVSSWNRWVTFVIPRRLGSTIHHS